MTNTCITNRYILAMDWVYRVGMWFSGISLLIMVLIIPIGIFGRYVMNSGYSWPEPVAIICMVTFTFIGTAISYRAGSHIAVTMVTDKLPEPAKKFFALISELLMVAISLFILFYGYSLCAEMWTQPIAELPAITEGMKYLPLPIGSFITLLFIIERILFGPQTARPLVMLGNAG